MKRKFVDYDGPTGAYVATSHGILPLDSVEGMAAVMDSAMLVSLGNSEKAAEYEQLVKKARAERLAEADQHPSS